MNNIKTDSDFEMLVHCSIKACLVTLMHPRSASQSGSEGAELSQEATPYLTTTAPP